MTFARHGTLTEQRALYMNIVLLGKVQFCACSEVTQLRRSPFQPNRGAELGGLQDSDSSHMTSRRVPLSGVMVNYLDSNPTARKGFHHLTWCPSPVGMSRNGGSPREAA
jgi:hypothetical protein